MDFSKSFEEVLKKNFKGNFKENFKEIAQEKKRLMQEILGIRRNAYIQVQDGRQVTYGGSQLFFRPLQDKCSQRKYRGGCGMVALGDLLLYLMEKEIRPYQLDGITYHTVFEEKEAYRTYFNKLCRKLKWFPTQNGMSGILMAIRFNAFMWKRRMPYRARWGLFENVRERRIERMLQKDLPVILCIPRVLLPWQREDRLPLYMESSGQMKQVDATRAHYVTITGLVSHQRENYYRISSWGRMYYISVKEYRDFVRTHLFGTVLGNILYITSKIEERS